MSRKTIYFDDRYSVVTGYDIAVGNFIQIYDNTMRDCTPEGEGLILDWSSYLKYETNNTTIPNHEDINAFLNAFMSVYYIKFNHNI